MLVKINIKFFMLLAIFFVGMKYINTQLTINELKFLISPVQFIISLFTKTKSSFIDNQGYYFNELNIVIDRSCAGFNLWIISYLCLGLLSIKHGKSTKKKVIGLGIALVSSYVFTILANSSRILLLIVLQDFAKIDWLHEGVGVITNLTFLMITYILTDLLLTKNQHS